MRGYGKGVRDEVLLIRYKGLGRRDEAGEGEEMRCEGQGVRKER